MSIVIDQFVRRGEDIDDDTNDRRSSIRSRWKKIVVQQMLENRLRLHRLLKGLHLINQIILEII
jgi:hypothetical protein